MLVKNEKMKKILLLIYVVCLIISCGPPKSDFVSNNNQIISVSSKMLNYKDTFNLGDTLKFYFEVSDSVIFQEKLTKVNIENSDVANFYPFLNIVDTSQDNTTGGFGVLRDRDYNGFATIGTFNITNKQLSAANLDGKFKALYCIVPLKQGVYFLEERNLGFLTFNNNSNRSNLHFNLGSIKRNFDYILKNIAQKQIVNMTNYLVSKGENQPNELFAFYVK